jgi:hypothetical protein
LIKAVQASETAVDTVTGDHCRWCTAKPVCPSMTGAVERALKTQLSTIDADQLAHHLARADMLEEYVKSVRDLAFTMLNNDVRVPGYKLVAKRGIRQWVNDEAPVKLLGDKAYENKLISVAQAEKLIGKKNFPADLAVSVSSGSTLATEDDPRPAILNLSRVLTKLKEI